MNKNTKQLVPKLRFPEFRDSGAWEEKTLNDVCNMQAGKFVRAADIFDKQSSLLYPCYGGNGQRGFTKSFTHEGKYSLIGRQGALCGNITLASGKFHATEHAVVVSPHNDVNTDWLFYMLGFMNLNQHATGQAQPGLSVENLEKLPIAISTEEKEQQKIADCLTSIDDLISAQSQKVEALKTHKKGLMRQIFPREGETVPRLRFPEFRDAGEWVIGVFDNAVNIIDGDRGANYPKAEEFSRNGFCVFLNAKNVTKNGFAFDEVQFISQVKDDALRKGKLKKSDVILTTRGSVGHFAIFSEDIPYDHMRINSGMVILRLDANLVSSKYLYSFCKSEIMSSTIEDVSYGNAQQQLTVAGIKKLPLYYPKPEEQQKIADCLSSIDELISAQSQKLESLKKHKKGLMQQLFPIATEVEA